MLVLNAESGSLYLDVRRSLCFWHLWKHIYVHTPKEYPKDEQEADPDGDGLGDVDLLPVLVLELVEVLAARGADPGGGHASGGRAHLTIHSRGPQFH